MEAICPRCGEGLIADWFGDDHICAICGCVLYGPLMSPPGPPLEDPAGKSRRGGSLRPTRWERLGMRRSKRRSQLTSDGE